MAFKIPTLAYTGSIRPITLEKNGKKVIVGGGDSYPFYAFEGEIPHVPKIAIQVPDFTPEEWADACLEPYKDVLGNPVGWAKKAQDVYKADIIFLWLKSTDPNGLNRSADEAAETAKQVLEAIDIPLIVWGSTNVEKDAEVLRKVAMACSGKKVALGPVQEGNHKQIGAQALAYNHMVVASSPIDINLAKQLNILLGNLGVPPENILIDPTTGAIGYGIEYSYSVMERIRQAALTQQDEKLQFPMISNLADEVWKTKEAKLADNPLMGKALNRGVTLEAMTAVTLLLAGADILVMRHPKAIESVRNYIADMSGVSRPALVAVSKEVSKAVPGAVAAVANLPRGIKLDIDIAKIMNAPLTVGSDHVLALVKVSEEGEGGITLSPDAVKTFSAFLEAKKAEVQPAVVSEEAGVKEKKKKKAKEVPPVKILDSWAAPDDNIGEFNYQKEKKQDFSGKQVELLGASYEAGTPERKEDWRQKLRDKEEMIQYLKTGLRYWYSAEVYGSEKRKTPA
ncbi:MAG: acetyl-CoA decarbonylase/synthase complex subunit delta [Thermodesulfobacteriota bacterium]|jgi:CO dehydrogenase/acetyl-CoA synthase delta subunit|nr:MAG: acetyl-CoA decarbonylase/synthase complex subunit delta [Thermodesulfobacteriota bacterium]